MTWPSSARGWQARLESSELSDGDHTVKVTATDAAGNESGSFAGLTVNIDTAPPTATITTGPVAADDMVNVAEGSGSVAIVGTVGGDVPDGATVTVTVNGVNYTGTVSSSAFSIPVFGSELIADGDLTVSASVTVTDAAGNGITATDTRSYALDQTAPSAPAITGYDDDTGTTDDGSTSDDNLDLIGTAEAGSAVRIYDGEVFLGSTVADELGAWTLDTGTLSLGLHAFTVLATDSAGNASATSDPFEVTIISSNSAPAALALSRSTVGANLSSIAIGILSAVDPEDDQVTWSIQPGQDGALFALEGSQLRIGAAGLGVGDYQVTVRATDALGAYTEQTLSISAAAKTIYNLTIANDTFTMPPDGGYVVATHINQLNSGDVLTGGLGQDVLLVSDIGNYNISNTNGVDEVQIYNNDTVNPGRVINLSGTKDLTIFSGGIGIKDYWLGPGKEIVYGSAGSDRFGFQPSIQNERDILLGGDGFDTLYFFTPPANGSTKDIRGLTFHEVENIELNYVRAIVDQEQLRDVTNISLRTRLTTMDTSFDITGITFAEQTEINTLNITGTIFIVDSVGAALKVRGGVGYDLLSAPTLSLTTSERTTILATLGEEGGNIEAIQDGSGIYGYGGENTILGTTLGEVISGGGGVDTLTGGLGVDMFQYASPGEGGDTITDFQIDIDKLKVSAIAFGGGLTAGSLDTSRLLNSAGHAADQAFGQFLYDSAEQTLYWDSDGTGGNAPVKIVYLSGVAALSVGDFIVS